MSERLRLVFAGTPDFAVPSLRACLAAECDVVAVYTQPDRPSGRGRKLNPSAVKQAAVAAGVPVEQPDSLRSAEARRRLAEWQPHLLVVVAYGLILPRTVLALPRHGCWNVHASLLPRWRGAAPIQRAILAGDSETGVDLMQMEAGLDTGPILLERRTPIGADETGGSLHDRLSVLGADALGEGLRRLANGTLPDPVAQSEQGIVYAHKLEKGEALLDWNAAAIDLERKVRAFDPWPVAEARIGGERLRIWSAQALPAAGNEAAGTILAASNAGLDVRCGEGLLRITEMQRDGGRRIGVRDWLNARPELAARLPGSRA
ncbi:methionyl-tRNA formyltransferase [Dokdonella immobilis]|uniref:Methionyl-tRNA formyltransferase n=1 Tax=Dokdonella immobilis TaxID=578942 RepID=A0A1I5ACF3_9GAMM|nr:methionyl-tRNA formyltransferase [Dokdonella immobilis]SFN60083.1 methionyl-tRNA formyltransferase [Dokdonella immobilis]